MIRRRFGAHLSTHDGMRYAAIAARAMAVESMQIMVGEGFSWSPYKLTVEAVAEFKKLSYGVAVYVHLPYTINPCLGREHQHHNMQSAVMRKYLDVCDAVGATACVLHPGYKKELGETAAKANFVRFMDKIQPYLGNVRLLFETDSGSKNGSKVGSASFIKSVLKDLGREKFGMVIDTEHLWARGVDLWDDDDRADFIDEYGSLIELVHLNVPDEGVGLGSFVDRHSTPIESFPKDSVPMMTEFVAAYPCVVERKSLVVTQKDVKFIQNLVPAGPAGMTLPLPDEGPYDDHKDAYSAID